MKNLRKKLILVVFVMGIFMLTNCKRPKPTINKKESTFQLNPTAFQGKIISETITLNSDTAYILSGPLVVEDGASLIIPEGTTIKATGGTSSYIAVAQGGKIQINGTENNPVVMTSGMNNPQPADWGGLVICGKAPTNKGGDNGETATAEVSELTYGGSDPNDSSGTVRYLRIEYSGANFTSEKEFNGLSLFGVGSGTTIEYVQSYKGSDDGIEFFGGTVSARYLISTDSGDDGIDFADGWSGTGEYWYIKDAKKAGIEGSNNGSNGNAEPVTNATLRKVSIVMTTDIDGNEGAMYIKEGGGSWSASDVYVKGYDLGIKIKDSDEPSITRVNNGSITLGPLQFDPQPITKYNNYDNANGVMKITEKFITENDNKGAGNNDNIPDWAQEWIK